MSVKIGDRFDDFIVVSAAKQAVERWENYHEMCNLYNITKEGVEKETLGAYLDKEYKEISNNQYMMGVGLWCYNEARRRA